MSYYIPTTSNTIPPKKGDNLMTKKRIMQWVALCALGLLFVGCGATDTPVGTDAETEKKREYDPSFVTCISPADGETVSLLNTKMTKWTTNYGKGKLDSIWKIEERCEPVGVTLAWECKEEPLYYHVVIADNEAFENAEKYLVSSTSLYLGRLYMGTDYFWRVDATLEATDNPGEPGDIVKSEVRHFTTRTAPRTMAVEGVSNMRDIGGYTTADGQYRVKQGMVYRGAHLDNITEAGLDEMLNKLGVTTELDVRGGGLAQSTLGKDVKYISVSAPWYSHVFESEYKQAVLTELRAFTNPDNYPIYFHCSLGRDRTGTLAFMLGCILNVEESDLFMDYETSFFSDYGGNIDNTKPSDMLVQLNNFINDLKTKTGKRNLNEAMNAYLLSIGMTQDELDAIRANLLEEIQ